MVDSRIKKKEKKSIKVDKRTATFTILLSLLLLFSVIVAAQPTPHNIQGRVFLDNAKTNNGPGGLIVILNNTINDNITVTQTIDPGPPPLRGFYAATIVGNDGDFIRATSWNDTHYGVSNASLQPTTTTIDIVLNRTRDSEPNVTIILPANNSIRNSTPFNITANISILGSDATSCTATIFFSNTVANITEDQTYTKSLGNVNLHEHQTATWNATGITEGTLNVTVSARCASDGVILEHLNSLHHISLH